MDEIFAQETNHEMSFELTLNARRRLVWNGLVRGDLRQYAHEPYASLSRRILVIAMGLLPLESQL
jgi:putative cardiolipin synthase